MSSVLKREESEVHARKIAGLIGLAFVISALAAAPARAAGPTVAVLFDFGDGTYAWARVTLPAENVSAMKATDLANRTLNLPPLEVTWASYSFCARQPCGFVDDIGDRDPEYPAWWHLLRWNVTVGEWASAPLGPSDLDLIPGDAIAWYLAVDDPETYPHPVPRPDFPDVQTSFRADVRNTGAARGTIPKNPALLWDRDIGVLEIDTTPVVAYGRVYVATRDSIVALDAATGREAWRNGHVGSLLSTPAIYDGQLILGGTDGRLHSLNAFTGEERWSVLLEGSAVRSTGIASSPTVFEGRAYIGTLNETDGGMGRVAAVNVHNGTIAWTYETASVHMSQPAIAGGSLYVGVMGICRGPRCQDGFDPPYGLLSLRLNGTLNWFYEVPGSVASSPVVATDKVYFTAKSGDLYALDRGGGLAWRLPLGESTSSPSLVDEVLYVASGGFNGTGAITAVDLSGSVGAVAWETDIGEAVQASLVADGDRVCGATNAPNGRYICLHAGNGTIAWAYVPSPRQYILGSPIIVGDTMYVPSDNGHVYAFRDPASRADDASLPILVAVASVLAALAIVSLLVRRRKRGGGSRDA